MVKRKDLEVIHSVEESPAKRQRSQSVKLEPQEEAISLNDSQGGVSGVKDEETHPDIKPVNSSQQTTDDTFVLGPARSFPSFREAASIAPWGQEYGVPDVSIRALTSFGVKTTHDLVGLEWTKTPHPGGLALGHLLLLRVAVEQWLAISIPVIRPFFPPGYIFLPMPIKRMLYKPSEARVLKKLQDCNVTHTLLLRCLSRDHVEAAGLTEDDCFCLEQAGMRDAVKRGPSDPWHLAHPFEAEASDLWLLGSKMFPRCWLSPSSELSTWCEQFQVEDEIAEWLAANHFTKTHDLADIFIPRIPIHYFLLLRKAVESWLPGKVVSFWSKFSFPTKFNFPDMDMDTFIPEESMGWIRAKVKASGIRNTSTLKWLCVIHLKPLGGHLWISTV
uniref:Uncharacterized protein n=1 Tax=Moniliophthora roreri TaxID=221103 RepID=A0A0W0G600_MONRR